eukprot:6637227-Prymnesium_polylepis.1
MHPDRSGWAHRMARNAHALEPRAGCQVASRSRQPAGRQQVARSPGRQWSPVVASGRQWSPVVA